MIEQLLRQHREQYTQDSKPATLKIRQFVYKLLAGSSVPAQWLHREYKNLPAQAQSHYLSQADAAQLTLEIVSHCWKYTHYLAFQLGSLIANPPPANMKVVMTVFFSAEDTTTLELLQQIQTRTVPNVEWNWQELPPAYLFRRSIGRNFAAKSSSADWVWFTDCDETFQAGCLDTLNSTLPGCKETLVYPTTEYRTMPLHDNEIQVDLKAADWLEKVAKLPLDFHGTRMTRATGPLQITRGDIARQFGYCDSVHCYQYPEDSWSKAHEDRIFRWLLGTKGTAIEIPGVYRIQHAIKGRQSSSTLIGKLRQGLRHRRYQRVRDDFGQHNKHD